MATATWTPGAGAWTDPEVTELQGCHQRAPLLQVQEEFGDPEKKVAEEMEHLWGLQWPVRQGPRWLAPSWGHLPVWWAVKQAAADFGKLIALNAAT